MAVDNGAREVGVNVLRLREESVAEINGGKIEGTEQREQVAHGGIGMLAAHAGGSGAVRALWDVRGEGIVAGEVVVAPELLELRRGEAAVCVSETDEFACRREMVCIGIEGRGHDDIITKEGRK